MTAAKRPEQPSHADLRHDLDVVLLTIQGIQKDNTKAFGEIGRTLDHIKEIVGHVGTDERGDLIGTGIAGDLGRLRQRVDRRFGQYDGWIKYAAGALASLTVLGAVIWWLVRERIGFLQ
jgi:hypothetical protein